ncbi:MAG: porin family protein [Neptuniibacter sp.]
MNKLILSSALAATLLSSTVFADSNFYLGGSIGQTEVDYVPEAGATVTDDSDTSWKIFGGYNINENFAVEVAYQDLGDNSAVVLGQPTYIDGDALSISLVGKLPINDQFGLFGKLGYADVEADADVPSINASVSASDSDVLYGIGAVYSVTEAVDVRLEWEHIDLADEIDTVSLGVSYNF